MLKNSCLGIVIANFADFVCGSCLVVSHWNVLDSLYSRTTKRKSFYSTFNATYDKKKDVLQLIELKWSISLTGINEKQRTTHWQNEQKREREKKLQTFLRSLLSRWGLMLIHFGHKNKTSQCSLQRRYLFLWIVHPSRNHFNHRKCLWTDNWFHTAAIRVPKSYKSSSLNIDFNECHQ